MAAGKLVLLLVAGGLAGAAFAGMTTGVMRPYRDRVEAPSGHTVRIQSDDDAPYAAPAHPSWLDEGISLLDSPAWPFGHGSGDEDAAPPYPAPEGYAPGGYDLRERPDDGRWDHDDRPRRGYRDYGGYAQDGYAQNDYADAPAPPAYAQDSDGTGRLDQPAPRQDDAASDAARRAADAAQDVIAAERGR